MNWRKVLGWLLVIFALYAMYQAPDQVATFVRIVGDLIGTLVSMVVSLFDSILRR